MSQCVGEVLRIVGRGDSLSSDLAEQFLHELMSGYISPIQTAGVLSAMAVRGETVEEIVGFALAMRNHSIHLKVPFPVIDTCGTGGDGADTFNISTASAFVAAAAGIYVAKHGNRAVSSKSGSADVLAALGAYVELKETEALKCLEETHLCFLFAQSYHPAMKYAAEPRKQLGFRTIFNILGPLTNPAGAKRQVIGVYRPELVSKVAEALLQLGSDHVLVVHGAGGMDEFSLQGDTMVAEVRDGKIKQYALTPEEVGLHRAPISELMGGDALQNAEIIQKVFSDETGAKRDVILFNAGAALYVGGLVESIHEGIHFARNIITNGAALELTKRFATTTQRLRPSEVITQ